MRLLLDTQVFIWWDSESHKLPSSLLQLCTAEENTLVLSVASVKKPYTGYWLLTTDNCFPYPCRTTRTSLAAIVRFRSTALPVITS